MGEHIARTGIRLDSLLDRYRKLGPAVAAGGSMRDKDELIRPSGALKVPVNLGAVDLMGQIEKWFAKVDHDAREVLGMTAGAIAADPMDATVSFLHMFLPAIYEADPSVGDRIADRAWSLDQRAAEALGEQSPAFPLAEVCGTCGMDTLWASPERMLVRCANSECAVEFAVSLPVPVASL